MNLNEGAKSMQIRYRCQHCYKEFEGPEGVDTCEVCGNHGGLFEIGRTGDSEDEVPSQTQIDPPAAPAEEAPSPEQA